jgi:hypothetical protein
MKRDSKGLALSNPVYCTGVFKSMTIPAGLNARLQGLMFLDD